VPQSPTLALAHEKASENLGAHDRFDPSGGALIVIASATSKSSGYGAFRIAQHASLPGERTDASGDIRLG